MFSLANTLLYVVVCSTIHLSSICEATCGVPYFKPLRYQEGRTHNRIYNGNEARKYSHPWQALIFVRFPTTAQKCGGSLIDWDGRNASDLVLTAAHCFIETKILEANINPIEAIKFVYKRLRQKATTLYCCTGQQTRCYAIPFDGNRVRRSKDIRTGGACNSMGMNPRVAERFSRRRGKYVGIPLANISKVDVFLGVHYANAENPNREKLSVVGLELGHYHQYSTREDIALLKLDRKVAYNKFIQGICLPSLEEELPARGSLCYVTGWGYLNKSRAKATSLQQIEVDIFGSMCNLLVNRKTMFCAGSKQRDIGTCASSCRAFEFPKVRELQMYRNPEQVRNLDSLLIRGTQKVDSFFFLGDSGGPLTCQKDGKFVLYGIVSFSIADICSHRRDPTVFAKVPFFIEWLRKEISGFSNGTGSS